MADGILVCGLNGSGKTTLGKALAAKARRSFHRQRRCSFRQVPTTAPCSRAEAAERLLAEIRAHSDFILADVRGDYGAEAAAFLPLRRAARCPAGNSDAAHSGARSRKIRAAHAAGRRPVRA